MFDILSFDVKSIPTKGINNFHLNAIHIPCLRPEGDGGKLDCPVTDTLVGTSGRRVPLSIAKSFSCFLFISSSPSSYKRTKTDESFSISDFGGSIRH